jgi:hypothetical protein
MFENLDDPKGPNPAPVENVVTRGKQLRLHRRLIIVATTLFVVAGTIATVAALQAGGGHRRVLVTTEPSSTTEPDTTVPTNDTSPTTNATSPTTDNTAPTTVGAVTPTTQQTTTTQPPHDPNDLSMVSVSYEGDTPYPNDANITITTGQEAPFTYTVTNNGSWDVQFGTCGDNQFVSMWSIPATQAWPPYSDGFWPMPSPNFADEQPDVCPQSAVVLSPGASLTRTVTLLAGYRTVAGDVIPAPPGFTAYVAPFLPACSQPCDPHTPRSAWVTVEPPVWPAPASIYSINYKTQHMSIPSGQSSDAEITYTNPLAVTIRIPLYGPCWHVALGNGSVDCSGSLPVLTVAAHESVDLHGTVWARQGFLQSGAPLAKGRYMINMGDRRSQTLGYTDAEATWVDVT